MPSTPHLLVVDQSLKGFVGHHYEYSRSVIAAADAMGIEPMLACHEEFSGVDLAGAPIVGRFAEDWAAANRSILRGVARDVLSRLPQTFRHLLLGMVRRKASPSSAALDMRFAHRLLEILSTTGLGPGDHVFIHTVGEAEFLGLIEVLAESPAPTPLLHVVLRYDGTSACREAFSKLPLVPARLRFWTDTEALAAQYRDLGCPEIGVLPIPHGLDALPVRTRPAERILTLAYLGEARGDKGFHLLPGLVEALADDYLATGRVRFLIQANYGFSREEALMAQAKVRLARFPDSWVHLIEAPLDVAAFAQALLSTDLLLLPYDPDTYRRRSSGLLVQAMVAGIPTVVPAGTWLAAEAPEGACAEFADSASLIDTVRRALDNYDELAPTAVKATVETRHKHDVDTMIRLILGK